MVSLHLGEEVMSLLYNQPNLEVWLLLCPFLTDTLIWVQVIVWPHQSSSGKEWLMKNIGGADGCIIMLFEKVSIVAIL